MATKGSLFDWYHGGVYVNSETQKFNFLLKSLKTPRVHSTSKEEITQSAAHVWATVRKELPSLIKSECINCKERKVCAIVIRCSFFKNAKKGGEIFSIAVCSDARCTLYAFLRTSRARLELGQGKTDGSSITVDECDVCGTLGHLSKCGKCGVRRYCSRRCQSSHWKKHKRECAQFLKYMNAE